VKELKGRKVGVEVGCLSHELLVRALTDNVMTEKDVTLVPMPTHQAAQVLSSGDVDAIVAWQPHSGMALKAVEGSTAVYTTAQAPGLIYDTLAVAPGSLLARREEWQKVVAAWYDVVAYMGNPANEEEALKILSARVGIAPATYKPFLAGTRLLSLEESLKVLAPTDAFDSLLGSSVKANDFFLSNKVYKESVNAKRCIDPSFTKAVKRD
jgi:NitT/TauT family transport system substrate-binding protein